MRTILPLQTVLIFPKKNQIVKTPTNGGIKEQISLKYAARYQKWKAAFLSTEIGREQWKAYAENKNFVLNITISDDEAEGAGTGDYKWNDAGHLVGAEIRLGSRLDRGFPKPVYFPVLNSMSIIDFPRELGVEILAAAKFAHEFGHVNFTSQLSWDMVRLQNKLMPDYNKILLGNGYNTRDQRLVEIVQQLGGTPVEIWENREYWSEINALNFLVEKINQENFYCRVLNRIETNVRLYAVSYENRFQQQIAQTKKMDSCGW